MLNERKIITIILDECKSIEERHDEYKEKLGETITEIIILEKQHREEATNIRQQINDKLRRLVISLQESGAKSK